MRFSSTLAVATLGMATFFPGEARAYRPFDQTDADVVEHGRVEIELGPAAVGWSREELVLVAPSLVVNVGIRPGVELVLEGKNERTLRPSTDQRWRPQD